MPASLEHAQEEDLERYSIGTLSVPQGEALEEHLLICHACQDRLAEVDAYVQTVRVAASRLRLETPLSHPRGGFWGLFSKPVLAICAVAAAFLILGVWVSRFKPSASSSGLPPVAVLLRTVRGPSGAIDARAPGGQPLILRADLSGLHPQALWELEVVDARGLRVYRSAGAALEGRLEARLTTGLTAGQYWVRVSAASGSGPLREYALRVD